MRISIALCTFNGQAHLAALLRSLAVQERLPDELIVRDDASTDQTMQIIRDFTAGAPFPVRLEQNPQRLGAMANFASAIAAADGDVIACCDQDDVWYPEKLAIAEAAFLEKEPADIVLADADLVDENLLPLGRRLWESIGFGASEQRIARAGRLWSVLTRFNVVTGAGMAFLSKWRDLILPIPPGWVYDGWIGMLLSIVGRCKLVSERTWAYRQHPAQLIGAGPLGLSGQIAAARRMDRAYFQGLEKNYTTLIERLGNTPIDLDIARALRNKVIHCRSRVGMRAAGSRRMPLIAGELLSGRYHHCSLGWKSWVQDLWLARPSE